MKYETDYVAVEDVLVNYKNYGPYAAMIQARSDMEIDVENDLSINNIDDHIDAMFNIFKDGIESDYIHNCKILLKWSNAQCKLSLPDYWLSLFMWSMILQTENPIRPKHIFVGSKADALTGPENALFPWELKKKDIQHFINTHILTLENKIHIGNIRLNEIIEGALWRFCHLEHFAYYFANTINNEDDIDLMRHSPEFDSYLHCSLARVPLDQVKQEGMAITNKTIAIIKDSERYLGYEHGLTNSFRANEAINPRQFKEVSLNIGTKPNGAGAVYPYIIDKNFKTSGVNDPLSYFIESSTARVAQILSKINVGMSGEFARELGLNNTDTILNLDSDYECLSQHFIKYTIKTPKHLSMIKGRYFRYNPKGMDFLIDDSDMSMVGKEIYLHSPITCASNSSGYGICRKCYGTLYWVNHNINVGKFAAENISSKLTQILLSAKHLLETAITNIKWCKPFKDFFDIDTNLIKLNEDLSEEENLKKYTLIIDPDEIQLVSDEEDAVSVDDDGEMIIDDQGVYNEYITSFIIRTPAGQDIEFGSEDRDQELYISTELNNIIRRKAYNTDGKVNIPLNSLVDETLFYIMINNNEISKLMNDIKNLINKSEITKSMTKDELVQTLVDYVIQGNLSLDAIHLEVILSNQVVSEDNILKKPNWNDPNAKHKMITLNQALVNNPSVITSLLYKDLHKTLYNPLTFSKNAPSFFDLFFCEQPQNYMNDDLLTDDTSDIRDYEDKVSLYTLNNGGKTSEEEFLKKLEKYMDDDD